MPVPQLGPKQATTTISTKLLTPCNNGSRRITGLQLISEDPEAAQTLLWWHTFKPQPRSISRPLIKAVVMRDATKEDYGNHMKNLSFQG